MIVYVFERMAINKFNNKIEVKNPKAIRTPVSNHYISLLF